MILTRLCHEIVNFFIVQIVILLVFSGFRDLGIDTLAKCENEQQEMLKLAQTMFDTSLPPGVKMLQPFSEESSIKKIAVQVSRGLAV